MLHIIILLLLQFTIFKYCHVIDAVIVLAATSIYCLNSVLAYTVEIVLYVPSHSDIIVVIILVIINIYAIYESWLLWLMLS